jgi:hypothetical protein
MARMIAPTGMNTLSVTDARGKERVLAKNKDGTFHVNDRKLAKKLRQEGLGVAGLTTATRATGFICDECGFGGFFRKCGRCGHENKTT